MPRSLDNTLYSPAALVRFFLTAILGLAADLWTKSLAVSHLSGAQADELVRGWVGDLQLKDGVEPFAGRIVEGIHGWLQFEFIENPGAVFGVAPGKRWLFLAVSVAAVVFLTYLFSAADRRPFYQIILGLLLAGVLGNMYDRIEVGKVRDMIHMLPGWHWPAALRHVLTRLPEEVFPYIFNVADALLCTGVGLMVIYSFLSTAEDVKGLPGAKEALES